MSPILLISTTIIILFLLCCLLIVIKQILQFKNNELTLRLHREIDKERAFAEELADLKNSYNSGLMTDLLTGLPSWHVFQDRLSQVISQSKRYQLMFGIIFLDIDGFKMVNNALGHDVGDALLKQVADRLVGLIRQVDTVSRFASDEFIIMAPQITKPEVCGYIAQRLLDAIEQPFNVNDQELFLTASVGIAVFPLDGEEGKVLLKNANIALSQAKLQSCNQYKFYREEMYKFSQRELVLRSSLRTAFIYQEFLIFYQPQVNVETKELVCMEAFLRWQNPQLGLIESSEFIRLVENSGKIIEIGDWVIRMACEQFHKWKSAGLGLVKVAVNVSFKQLENPHFVYNVSQILSQTQIKPESLVLEIADGEFHRIDLLEKNLQMLRQIGVQIAIDDLGTGHLSLQQLKRFPVQFLKIDCSLVQDVNTSSDSVAIINMILALAKILHLSVIAEGVETLEQKAALQMLGCVVMQGRLFSDARKPEDYSVYVEKMITNM